MTGYTELHCLTNFSFLRGASHPDELVAQAQALGLAGLGITDINSLAGVVRAHVAAKAAGLPLHIGCQLELTDGTALLAYPTDRAAYGRLSRLLSLGKRRAPKGQCHLTLEDVVAHAAGQWFIALPETPGLEQRLGGIREQLGSPLALAVRHGLRGDDRRRIAQAARLAARAGVPLVATGGVLYHRPERRPLQDVLSCIREGCTLDQAGFRLDANAERHLKAPAELARLWRDWPEALRQTEVIAEACRFSLDSLRYEYPDEPVPRGLTPQAHLEQLTWMGAAWRYPEGVPPSIVSAVQRELALIDQLGYAPYFLTVHDIVRWARAHDILCQGRGSAANSAVCYCLGITAVNPVDQDLLFERFISPERKEPPDIDVDFEHERREEVIQYIYARYGRARAGLTATVICYRPRSAVREVGKVLGLSPDVTGALAGTVWGSWGSEVSDARVAQAGLDPAEPRLARTLALANELIGFPRHLSQHVGGFVLTRGLLEETVPIGNAAMAERTFIEWDKDDIDALGILKVDVLALGMLTCIAKSFALLRAHHDRDLTLATLPREDRAVYDMLARADSLGVFQVESRAQMNMLPRLRPRCFYDLVIQVAIVRPGPIQGDMVHPYLRRRAGQEVEIYPSPAPEHGPPDELAQILKKTCGVPLFQEQAMRIAMVAACFSSDEVNALRQSMATFRKRGTIGLLQEKMVTAMIARGYDPDFARRCFDQIKGFGEYGFPESHAASFAHLVYVSSWLKCHYPDVFCVALLNSQPMGFYAPAQIVRDARAHGVVVHPPDVNLSDWDCTLEPAPAPGQRPAVRLGLRQVDGLGEAQAQALLAARSASAFPSVEAVQHRTGLSAAQLEPLAAADAFRSLGLDRRAALWRVRGLAAPTPLPLFAALGDTRPDPVVTLPAMAPSEHVVDDYRSLRLSLKGHPLGFLRTHYAAQGIVPCERLLTLKDGARVHIAGVVLVRQKPGSAKGVMFLTLEDETGIANAVIWPAMLERFRTVLMGARLIALKGRIQRHVEPATDSLPAGVPVIHVVAAHLEDRSADLALLSDVHALPPLAHADEVARPVPDRRPPRRSAAFPGSPEPAPALAVRPALAPPNLMRHPREARILPRSRDFH
jgi:error-prone DNA polymerase